MTKNADTLSAESPTQDARPNRWWRRLKLALVLLALLASLPSIVGLTGQTSRVLAFVSPELASATRIGSAKLHLWQPVELMDVEIDDPTSSPEEQRPLLTVGRIRSRQPLWQILSNRGQGIHLDVQKVELDLIVQHGLTNLESALQRFGLMEASAGAGQTAPYSVAADDVRVTIRETGQAFEEAVAVGPASVSVSTLQQHAYPEVHLQTTLHSIAGRMTSKSTPPLQPLARRPERTEIAARVDDLQRDVPLLPFTQEELNQVASQSEAQLEFNVLPEQQAGSGQRCHLLLQGLDLNLLEPVLHRYLPASQLSGRLGVQIDGVLPGKNVAGLAGRFLIQGNDVLYRGHQWAEGEQLDIPSLSADGALAIADDGVLIQRLKVDSKLLSITGDGEVRREGRDPVDRIRDQAADRPDGFQQVVDKAAALANGRVQVKARLDVARLCAMLPRTLSLNPDVRINDGQVLASCRVDAEADSAGDLPPQLKWRLAVQPTEFKATTQAGSVTVDSDTRIDLAGGFDGYQPTLDVGRLKGSPGDLQLRRTAENWHVAGRLTPRRLWQQFGTLIDVPPPELDAVRLDCRVAVLPDRLRIPVLRLDADQIQIEGDGLSIWYDRPALESVHGRLKSAGSVRALAVIAQPFFSIPESLRAANYDVTCTADSGRKFDMHGRLDLSSDRSHTGPSEALINASLVRLVDGSEYKIDAGRLAIPGLRMDVQGSLNAVGADIDADLQATCHYDLAQLQQQFVSDLGSSVYLTGKDSATFSIRGNPFLISNRAGSRDSVESSVPPLAVSGSLRWDGGQLAGLSLQPGDVALELENGYLRSSRIDCGLGNGRLAGMAQWDMVTDEIQLASGSRLDDVDLTPELCDGWFRYVSPLLARSASAEGRASVRIERFVWNMAHNAASQADAELEIDYGTMSPSASVQPVLQALSVLTKERLSDTSVRLPAQKVRVQLQNGRVSHNRFLMMMNDYPLTTEGSVHLSGPVHLTLHLPTRRDAQFGSGDVIPVPVRGTTSRPQVDVQALLQNAGQQQIQDRLNRELDRGLNRLFDKIK